MKTLSELIPTQKWFAYWGHFPCESKKPHIIIIIRRDETHIKYLYVTSQVEKAGKRYKNDKSAIAKLSKGECGKNWNIFSSI